MSTDAWGISWGSPSAWGVSWVSGVVPPSPPAVVVSTDGSTFAGASGVRRIAQQHPQEIWHDMQMRRKKDQEDDEIAMMIAALISMMEED